MDTKTKGRIGVAAVSPDNPVSTGGDLLYLRFKIIGSTETTALNFETKERGKALFEDGFGNKISSASLIGSFKTSVAPSKTSVAVFGRVTTADGSGIRNVTVRLVDENEETKTILTSEFGYYQFADVAAGRNYTIIVSTKKFSFAWQSQTLAGAGEIAELNFVADF